MFRALVIATPRVLVASFAACSAPDTSTDNPSNDALDTTAVTPAWSSTLDEAYLPLLMAVDAVKETGNNTSAQVMSESDVSFQSLAGNQIQFTADSPPPGALSIDAGAPIRAIGTRNANLLLETE
jgi:hypothetical protein